MKSLRFVWSAIGSRLAPQSTMASKSGVGLAPRKALHGNGRAIDRACARGDGSAFLPIVVHVQYVPIETHRAAYHHELRIGRWTTYLYILRALIWRRTCRRGQIELDIRVEANTELVVLVQVMNAIGTFNV